MTRLQVLRYIMLFFFQAEDGIRDYKVTGVQTCALPIYRPRERPGLRDRRWRDPVGHPDGYPGADYGHRGHLESRVHGLQEGTARGGDQRSEERRGGEEGRSRWGPHHLKKKKTLTSAAQS